MSSHLREPGSDDEAAEVEEERGEALALQTFHQHADLRRHRYQEQQFSFMFANIFMSFFKLFLRPFQHPSSSSSGATRTCMCMAACL